MALDPLFEMPETPQQSFGVGGIFQQLVGGTIASGATIAPDKPVHHVTGTSVISTITPPWPDFMGPVFLIADGTWSWDTSGNIKTASVSNVTVGSAYLFFYDRVEAKWYFLIGSPNYPLLAPDGTIGAPSFSWAGDPDTGIYYKDGGFYFAIGGEDVFRLLPTAHTAYDPATGDIIFATGPSGGSHRVGNSFVIDWSATLVRFYKDVLFKAGVEYEDTFYEDLRVSVNTTKVSGATEPTWTQFQDDGAGSDGVYAYQWPATGTKNAWFEVQLPHGWKEGTNIHPHVHWASAGTDDGTIRWNLEYTWANINGNFGNTSSINMDDTGSGVAKDHLIAGAATDIVATGKTISSVLMCRLSRDNTVADNLTDAAWALSVDFHYEIDTPGSSAEFAK